jgi:hypothetical protein
MRTTLIAALSIAPLLGCGADEAAGTGSLVVTISGEDAAQTGFPVEDDGEVIAFADGWTLRFDKALAAVGAVTVAASDGTVGAGPSGSFVVDLTKAEAQLARFDGLAARRWDAFSYELAAPSAGATAINAGSADDVARMASEGLTYWFTGSASKDGRAVRFDWKFKNPTKNSACTDGDDGKQGVVVPAGSSAKAQVTVHLDHLFWTSIGSEGGVMRFDPIAAVAGDDGLVSLDELAQQPLVGVKDASGADILDGDGKPLVYDPGSTRLDEDNLRGFVTAGLRYSGHLNGGGLCTITRR